MEQTVIKVPDNYAGLWEKPEGTNPSLLIPFLTGVILVMLLAAGWFVVAYLNPPIVVIGVTFKTELTYQQPLPPGVVQDFTTSAQLETPLIATGQVLLPDGAATGKVRFLSLEGSPVTLQRDTVILQRGDVTYKLLNAVTIPASSISGAGVADSVVIADKPGEAGNLPVGIGSYILRGAVKVSGLGPVAGGSSKAIQVVTAQDIEKMRSQLDAQIPGAGEGKRSGVIPETFYSFKKYEVVKVEYSLPGVGSEIQPGGKAGAVVALKYRGFDPAATLQGVQTTPAPFEGGASILEGPTFKGFEEASYQVTYTRKVNPAAIYEMLDNWQGDRRQFNSLVAYLRTLPEIQTVSIPDLTNLRGLGLKLEVAQ